MAEVLFFIAGIGAIAGAIGVVLLRNPFYSVLALVFHLLSLAALFLLLRAEFVAAAQVIVYAGAVMVLYVFVVAYVGGADEPIVGADVAGSLRLFGPIVGLLLFVELCIATLGSGLKALDDEGAAYDQGFGTPERDRAAAAHEVPAALRGRLVPAAGRGGRRGDPRAPAPGPRGPRRRLRPDGARRDGARARDRWPRAPG